MSSGDQQEAHEKLQLTSLWKASLLVLVEEDIVHFVVVAAAAVVHQLL